MDRRDAGKCLAALSRMKVYADRFDVVVLGLPRGGIPVAYEVAKRLHAPLDVFVVRKLGVPIHPELAMGAIATGGAYVLNQEVIDKFEILKETIQDVIAEEVKEVVRQEHLYRDHRKPSEVKGRTAILIDDGLATGASMRAAVQSLRSRQPDHIVMAVPVASIEASQEFKEEVDETLCVMTPASFIAVGQWYEDFSQISDKEVRKLLAEAQETPPLGV